MSKNEFPGQTIEPKRQAVRLSVSNGLIGLSLLFCSPALAQASQFDLSWLERRAPEVSAVQSSMQTRQQLSRARSSAAYIPAAYRQNAQPSFSTGPRSSVRVQNRARQQGTGGNRAGLFLPPVSTSSVDINICDESSGTGRGGDGGGGSGNSSAEAPPALPPGWAGVMCHGVYAGAIPPGGTVEAFWRGEYGFAGDEAQQAALLREGQWLFENGQIVP